MKKKFLVGVREVHLRYYTITARDPGEAKDLVHDRAPGVEDLGWEEYSHELDRDTWSVEEYAEGTQAP